MPGDAVLRQDLPPAEDIAVEAGRAVDVPHIQHQVAEFFHFHAISVPGRPTLTDMAGRTKSSKSSERVPKQRYERELFRLQAELVKMQEWVRTRGARLVVVFEGRDAAGKGGTIKRITEYLNPRVARGSPRCRRRPSASAASGTSSATSRTCRPPARSCCSTGPGTTAPASSR